MRYSIRTLAVMAAVLTVALALPAQAGHVFLAGDSNIFTTTGDNEVFFQNVFNGKSVANYGTYPLAFLGTTASSTFYDTGTAITSAGLGSNDFMIFGFNRSSVSASELSAITSFYNGGGSLFLYGEGIGFTALNDAVNSILSAVGSTMSLSSTENFDQGGLPVTTLTGLVGNGPFAAGVNSWDTLYASKINIGSGQAVISGIADEGFFGVAIGLESAAVPEPASLAMWSIMGGIGFMVRRKRRRTQVA